MARGNDRRTKRTPRSKDFGRRGGKKKVCVFCKEHLWVDYKDVNLLRRFQSDRGKIRARRVTGNCTQHHREVAVAIKTARELALLPYTQRTVVERAGGRSLRTGSSPDRERPTTVDADLPLPMLPDAGDLAGADLAEEPLADADLEADLDVGLDLDTEVAPSDALARDEVGDGARGAAAPAEAFDAGAGAGAEEP